MKDFGFKDHKNEKFIGALHSIVEVLYNVLSDKSWENVISIGMESNTFEGTVEYEDRILEGKIMESTFVFIHMLCFYVADLLGRFLEYDPSPDDSFTVFAVGYVEGKLDGDSDKQTVALFHAIRGIACKVSNYIPFIESLAREMVPDKRYTREYIEKKFSEMGFSISED